VNIIETTKGDTWPSSSDVDRALIERVIDAFGWEGARDPSYDPFSRK
jgi:hypothetical protein